MPGREHNGPDLYEAAAKLRKAKETFMVNRGLLSATKMAHGEYEFSPPKEGSSA